MCLCIFYVAMVRTVLLLAVLIGDSRLLASGRALPLARPLVRVLLWLPVHAYEPDDHAHDAVDCLFRRWAPSLVGQAFDVVVTLAAGDGGGDEAAGLQARAASLEAVVSNGVQHLLSPRPHITALPIILSTDTYDVDEVHGANSSFAGPNELFYRAMIPQEGVASVTTAPASSAPFLSTLIARYDLVQVVESDCCAAADGWLDALLQPMLDDPTLLISGSRGRGACWTGTENGGCKVMINDARPFAHLRDHINGNAMYRVGEELVQLVTSARDLYGSSVPFDVALHLASRGTSRAFDNVRAYSVMGLPVDERRFAEASYYGAENVAFVHVPRRLRGPAQQDVLRRLDTARPVTVMVVGPRVHPALLAHAHDGLVRARESRNAVYLVVDEEGYVSASRLAPMRVLMVDRAVGRHQDLAMPTILRSLASLARAGLAVFAIGVHDVVLQPYSKHLAGLHGGGRACGQRPGLWMMGLGW